MRRGHQLFGLGVDVTDGDGDVKGKGNGKGKSSSAFGTLARALGHGQRCAVIQFIKGRTRTGEHQLFSQFGTNLGFT